MTYALQVQFKSNERPWSTTYAPFHQPADDADAIQWAAGMSAGMGPAYSVILMKDGKLMFDPDRAPAPEEGK